MKALLFAAGLLGAALAQDQSDLKKIEAFHAKWFWNRLDESKQSILPLHYRVLPG